MAEPLDFELEIGSAADAQYPVAARVKDGGEASGTMAWSLTGRELDARLAAIRDSVLASSVLVRRLSTLDEQGGKSGLRTALAELERAGQVKLTWVQGQSWRDLRTMLDRGVWHVFHFIGHGGFDAQSGEGVLALAGEEGGTSPLGASAL